MNYAILQFEKRKGSSCQTDEIEKHHEHKKDSYRSNPDINTNLSHLNYHLVKPGEKYLGEINNEINDAGCRVRKDSVRFIDTIITASGEFWDNLSLGEQKKYFSHAYALMLQTLVVFLSNRSNTY